MGANKKAKTPAAKKPAGRKPSTPRKTRTSTHPENKFVPESALIKRDGPAEDPISETGPKVKGDKTLQIIDNRNSRPVRVSLIEGKGLTPETDGRLVFVESNVVHDIMSVDVAKRHFAVKKDGTVLYGQQGFDDVVGGDFDLVDIVKLIESNHK